VQYGLDYSAGEPTPAQLDACSYKIDLLIRYIGWPANGKCISHYPGAYQRHTAAGRVVLLVAEGSTKDAAGGFAAGVDMAQRALADARSIGYPDTLPIFLCTDGWLVSLGIPLDTALAYFRGGASVLGNARLGVYGFRDVINPARAQGIGGYRWLAGSAPNPAEIATGLCQFYQYNGGFVTVGGIACDLNWSYVDVHALASPTPGDPLMALTDGEAHELLGLARNLHYQLVTGDGTAGHWGWQTWAGGSGERLTIVDFLRRSNTDAQKIIARLDAILAAVKTAGVDPAAVRDALTAALGGGMAITGKAVPLTGAVALPEPDALPEHGGPADFDG